jgi:hypothetical protein
MGRRALVVTFHVMPAFHSLPRAVRPVEHRPFKTTRQGCD